MLERSRSGAQPRGRRLGVVYGGQEGGPQLAHRVGLEDLGKVQSQPQTRHPHAPIMQGQISLWKPFTYYYI